MKRIKYEEIQNSITNYIKQRNLTHPLSEPSEARKLKNNSLSRQFYLKKQLPSMETSLTDLSLTSLNDLVLIESSIYDYYSLSFNPASDQEYLKQFKAIKRFVEANKELDELLYPLFVHMCVDLSLLGCPIKEIVDDHAGYRFKICSVLRENEEQVLLKELLDFNETKDRSKCQMIDKWLKNKYQLKLTTANWKCFLNFLRNAKCHIFLRIINLHIQIIVIDHNDPEHEDQIKFEPSTKTSPKNIHPVLDTNLAVKLEKTSIDESTTTLTMDSLNSCINSINSQPSRINAACTYYINDSNSCITSSSISPDTSLISFTNDNSSIYLYKLNESVQSIFPEPSITTNKNNFQELLGGHSNVVFKSEFTHDSKYLLSCGADNISCLWDVNNSGEKQARQVCAYSGHLYPVWDLGVFSRLNLFSTASKDSTARLWSFERLYPLRVYCGHQSDVNCVRFHPNGAYLATGSSDKTVRLWSVQTGDFVRLFSGHRSRVFTVAFSPDGNYLASAGEDKKIKVWDLRSGLLFKELKGHTDIVHALCFDNHSEVLCSGGLDNTVKFWDIHRRGIQIGPNLTEKSPSGVNHSGELIRSSSLEFAVYSIVCDIQNVFYLSGAKKPQRSTQNLGLLKGRCDSDVNEVCKKLNENRLMDKKGEKLDFGKSSSPTGSMTINTRRRAAQAAATSSNSSTRVSNTSYLFSNNDDLYEA